MITIDHEKYKFTAQKLIAELQKYPPETKIFIASDEEHNQVFSKMYIQETEIKKSNNEGTYDALIIAGLSGSEVDQ